jgi:hypothetical protein
MLEKKINTERERGRGSIVVAKISIYFKKFKIVITKLIDQKYFFRKNPYSYFG